MPKQKRPTPDEEELNPARRKLTDGRGVKNTMIRVLLVEDEESAAIVLATILELEGFDVTVAPNGKRAIEVLEEVHPVLVITDYMMSMMDGIEMAKAIRTMPAFNTLPILMTSGDEVGEIKGYDSLLSAFLRKPFRTDALMDVIRRLLGNENLSG